MHPEEPFMTNYFTFHPPCIHTNFYRHNLFIIIIHLKRPYYLFHEGVPLLTVCFKLIVILAFLLWNTMAHTPFQHSPKPTNFFYIFKVNFCKLCCWHLRCKTNLLGTKYKSYHMFNYNTFSPECLSSVFIPTFYGKKTNI